MHESDMSHIYVWLAEAGGSQMRTDLDTRTTFHRDTYRYAEK